MNGFPDKPASVLDNDEFGIKKYIEGLKSFILECDTPMTIAIQGDWGSGKTSMMNMIKAEIDKKVVTTWFNTWQYSQFNMGDTLSVSFLSRLIAELEKDKNEKAENARKVLNTLSRFMRVAGTVAANKIVGSEVVETVKSEFSSESGEIDIDMPQAINELKEEFQKAVDGKIEKAGKDNKRLVVFIDDLDRLNPGKAVELLEVLKLFLDCEKCVFVLAIDYAVVSQGVKQKYGELIGEEKGRSFFDKIIQVPFKMPVAQYNVKGYVGDALKQLGVLMENEETDAYVRLIQRSVGCNPRAMKRLFNAFLLLNKIAEDNVRKEPAKRKMLFAILCLQLSFENIYNYIVQNADDYDDNKLFRQLKMPDAYKENGDPEVMIRELQMQNDMDIANAVDFMGAFADVIDSDANGELTEEEFASFVEVLRFSTITSNTSVERNANSKIVHDRRIENRTIAKQVLNCVQERYEAGPIFLYQTRTDGVDWKKHFAGGRRKFETSYGVVFYEFKIATDLQTNESALSVSIYPNERMNTNKFKEYMQKWFEAQSYGFVFRKEDCKFTLCDKTVQADAKAEIIEYFSAILPDVSNDMEKIFQA